MAHLYKQLIGGDWCDAASGRTRVVVDPATENAIREVPYGAALDCPAAISSSVRRSSR